MAYTALKQEQIPNPSNARGLTYAKEAIAFIREDCTDLKFDQAIAEKEKNENVLLGKSKKPGDIPYNMERDLDRLCLENAIARFVESGTRMDAFDVYYCYCEIFKPFGSDNESARKLLELLSDHESNASSLLEKHRDHYSHSVYVFLAGLAIYRKHKTIREQYNSHYRLTEGPQAAHHFLEHWGLTALFHDIGYPFQIAFEQMKTYFSDIKLDNSKIFASYEGIEELYTVNDINLNDWLWTSIETRFEINWPSNMNADSFSKRACAKNQPESRRDMSKKQDKFTDHAYFSAILLARNYFAFKGKRFRDEEYKAIHDCLCAIAVHNSLFRYEFQNGGSSLSLDHGMPLTYLLMLCDELQSWNRASYGVKSRKGTYPIDFDMQFFDNGAGIKQIKYYFNSAFEKEAKESSEWEKMAYSTQKGFPNPNSSFLDKINSFLCLKDAFPTYTSGTDEGNVIALETKDMDLRAHTNLSTGNYLNLYNLAVYLHAGYEKVSNIAKKITDEDSIDPAIIKALSREEKEKIKQKRYKKFCEIFEDEFSLEYKLSNIGQAKGFADCLHTIGCFYTDRMMDLDAVAHFSKKELRKLAEAEHKRWRREKEAMGWCPYSSNNKLESTEREKIRKHPAMKEYSQVTDQDKAYTENAMDTMLKLLKEEEGLLVYRF